MIISAFYMATEAEMQGGFMHTLHAGKSASPKKRKRETALTPAAPPLGKMCRRWCQPADFPQLLSNVHSDGLILKQMCYLRRPLPVPLSRRCISWIPLLNTISWQPWPVGGLHPLSPAGVGRTNPRLPLQTDLLTLPPVWLNCDCQHRPPARFTHCIFCIFNSLYT